MAVAAKQSVSPRGRRPAGKRAAPSPTSRFSLAEMIDERGAVNVDAVADRFAMSRAQLAETAGLAREVLQKSSRREGPKAQTRVREMLEIIHRVQGWSGGSAQAMAWYRAEPLPAFGGRTAEALVKSGQATAVRDYLDHLATGGYA